MFSTTAIQTIAIILYLIFSSLFVLKNQLELNAIKERFPSDAPVWAGYHALFTIALVTSFIFLNTPVFSAKVFIPSMLALLLFLAENQIKKYKQLKPDDHNRKSQFAFAYELHVTSLSFTVITTLCLLI